MIVSVSVFFFHLHVVFIQAIGSSWSLPLVCVWLTCGLWFRTTHVAEAVEHRVLINRAFPSWASWARRSCSHWTSDGLMKSTDSAGTQLLRGYIYTKGLGGVRRSIITFSRFDPTLWFKPATFPDLWKCHMLHRKFSVQRIFISSEVKLRLHPFVTLEFLWISSLDVNNKHVEQSFNPHQHLPTSSPTHCPNQPDNH